MTYECPNCHRTLTEDWCQDCRRQAVPVGAEAPRTTGSAPRGGAPEQPRDVSPLIRGSVAPAVAPVPDRVQMLQEGQRELEEYIRLGYRIHLVAGIGGVGKTQLLEGFERERAYTRKGGLAPRFKTTGGRVSSTLHGALQCYPVSFRRRRIVLVDASGEHFTSLYPYLRATRSIDPADVEFLKIVARHLAGLVLLLDLKKLWAPDALDLAGSQQQDILQWILMLLRWLRFGGRWKPESPIAFQDEIIRKVHILRSRLRMPVQVLFSRADELNGLEIPPDPQGLPLSVVPPGRKLFPAGENPLLFAYHCLPSLFGALQEHTDFFRFDFVHSLVLDPVTGLVAEKAPCGVASALEWGLDPSWRWATLRTRDWIRLQQTLDGFLRREERWERLPGALPL